MCQPGKPWPHGLSHTISRLAPAPFHSAQSAWNRLLAPPSGSTRCPGRRSSSRLPLISPYESKLRASKKTEPSSTA